MLAAAFDEIVMVVMKDIGGGLLVMWSVFQYTSSGTYVFKLISITPVRMKSIITTGSIEKIHTIYHYTVSVQKYGYTTPNTG